MIKISEKEYMEFKIYLRNSFYQYKVNTDVFEDIIIDGILTLLEKYDETKGASKKTFLYIIVKNNILMAINKQKKYTHMSIDDPIINILNYITDDTPEYDYEYDENKEKLHKAILDTGKNSEIGKLFFIDHYSIKDIMKKTNKSNTAVKATISRIKKSVRKNLI